MRRFALLLALVLLTGVCAIWIWNRDGARRVVRDQAPTDTEGTSARVPTSDSPREAKVHCTPSQHEPTKFPPQAPKVPEPAALPEFIDDDLVVAVQPLWVPDHGPAIARSGSRVEFDLADAKGQPLEPGTEIAFELWRKLGKHSMREGARLNAARSAIICDAFDQGGLEPGDYELSISCGPYGAMKREFHLARTEVRKERLETPHWRRIITLSFTDSAGKALPYLPLPPRYTAPGITYVAPERAPPPEGVLRAPPEPQREGFGMGSGRSSSSSRIKPASPSALRFPTDNGQWYVRVFAGGKGSIRFELDERLFGATVFQVNSDFTEPQWDNYVTAYNVPADFAAQMEQRKLNGADDPGKRSLLEPPQPVREPDVYDISELPEGYQRLIVSVSAPCAVTPRFWVEHNISQPKDKNPGPRQVAGNFHQQLGRWWLDLAPDSGIELEIDSPQLLRPAGKNRETIRLGESRIVEISRVIQASLLHVACPAPTLAALGTRVTAVCNGIGSPEGAAMWQPDGTLRLYVQRGAENFEGLGLATSLLLLSGQERRATGPLKVSFNDKQRQELALGGTTVSPAVTGLVLRAVGPSLEGLPWVEATLMEFDQDVASKRLRKHWQGSAAEMEECYGLLCKLAVKDVEPDHPDDVRLNELMEKMADPASRDWLRREGAWYNTHSRMQSSDHGYLCFDKALDPKKRYVLYLWSNSRSELMPDKRIDFVASEGVTDLGAVMLPTYKD
ncbi:MAG: hypothetical protein KBG84_09465 [Planctomycetes bacterium]|nr:hypothetical protein [Planctomycetota bacterium]